MKIIDLGIHPFSDTFIPKARLNENEPIYPLVVDLDAGAYIHLEAKTTDRYNLYDYSYTSSNSEFSRNHWTEFADMLVENKFVKKGSKVLEIGSNDGFLINILKNKGCKVLGVDASAAMCKVANKEKVKTLNMVFDYESSKKIKKLNGLWDVIIANNVFNHSDDPLSFARGVANLLSGSGIFVFELPYWYRTVKEKRFDQIYHEHRTYFTVKYSYNLLKEIGMEIINVDEVDYHGGSIRVFAKKSSSIKKNKLVKKFIKKETEAGLFEEKTYIKYMADITKKRNLTLQKIYLLKNKGYSIIGVGAAAKANTFLNFYNLDKKVIDYVTDTSPFKQGKYMPLSRIPIVSDSIFVKYDKVYAMILSWNLNLKDQLLKINPKIKFI